MPGRALRTSASMGYRFSARRTSIWTPGLSSVTIPRIYGEVRYRAVGWLNATLYTLIFTFTNDVYRAISLREASNRECKIYDEEN